MRIKLIISLFLFFALSQIVKAQELNCNVTVLTPNIQVREKRMIDNLKNAIREFVSNTRWTTEGLNFNERIECNILLTVTALNGNEYSGTMQIQAIRPVFNTSYNTTIVNVIDKSISFTFQEFQQLEYVKGTYVSDLTSILAFYSYIILGMDADSYKPLGGNPYFSEANSIVQSAQTANITGWKPNEKNDRNRYQLIFEIMDERMSDVRKAFYKYHRQGFDNMSDDLEKSREEIVSSIELLKAPFKFSPFSYLITCFFLAKKDELINLFKQAPTSQKEKVLTMLQELDVINANKYANDLR